MRRRTAPAGQAVKMPGAKNGLALRATQGRAVMCFWGMLARGHVLRGLFRKKPMSDATPAMPVSAVRTMLRP